MRPTLVSGRRLLTLAEVSSLFLFAALTLRWGGDTVRLPKHSGLLPRSTAVTAHSTAPAQLMQAYGKLPLRFEANQGQTAPQVKFLSRGNGYTLFLTGNEAVLTLKKLEPRSQKPEEKRPLPVVRSPARGGQKTTYQALRTTDSVLTMKLVGSNFQAKIAGLDRLPGKSNYFIGNDPKKWRTNVPTYAKVKYAGVYPGVDLVYYGNQQQLEYDFWVAPGADPSVIQFDVGAGLAAARRGHAQGVPLRIDEHDDLVVKIDGAEVRFHNPVIYQPTSTYNELRTTNSGGRHLVEGKYVLPGHNRIAFQLAKYDRRRPLVIDPVLSYSTYLGGNEEPGGGAQAIAVDSSGNAYITGVVGSADFPTTTRAFQSTCAQVSVGGCGAFVAKLNAAGTELLYSTYLAGSNSQTVVGAIAVDASGDAYVTGSTTGPDYPTSPGAFQPQPAPHVFVSSAFVTKLNAEGSALAYSTYLGDSGGGSAIAVDASGSAYVAGSTGSLDFPVTAGAFQTACKNPVTGFCAGNAFVTKFNPAGSALAYSTYLGGSGAEGDGANGIAVDSADNAYVAGSTHSSDFPTTPGAFQTKFVGGKCQIVPPPGSLAPVGTRTCSDAFVSKLNAAGSGLVYSTFLAGSLDDFAAGLAVDGSGNAYVAGTTDSSDFPTTAGAFQTASGRVFVTKLNPGGSGLVYSARFGGSGSDSASGIALDSSGGAYVAGTAVSTDFPTRNPIQARNAGGASDAFVAGLNGSGAGLLFSTYLGGTDEDYANGVAVDSAGDVYITGHTVSTNFPVTPGALKTSSRLYCQTGTNPTIGYSQPCGGMFVAKISAVGPVGDFALSPSPTSAAMPAGQSAAFMLKVTPIGGFKDNVALTCAGAPAAATCSVSPSLVTLDGSQESMASVTVTTTARSGSFRYGGPQGTPPGWVVWSRLRAAVLFLWLLVLATLAAFALATRRRASAETSWLALGAGALFMTLIALGMPACGGAMSDPGGGATGTPQGTYTLTLTGTYTAGALALDHQAQVSLTVQ